MCFRGWLFKNTLATKVRYRFCTTISRTICYYRAVGTGKLKYIMTLTIYKGYSQDKMCSEISTTSEKRISVEVLLVSISCWSPHTVKPMLCIYGISKKDTSKPNIYCLSKSAKLSLYVRSLSCWQAMSKDQYTYLQLNIT